MLEAFERNLKRVEFEKQLETSEAQSNNVDTVKCAIEILEANGYCIVDPKTRLGEMENIERLKIENEKLLKDNLNQQYNGNTIGRHILHSEFTVDSYYMDDYFYKKTMKPVEVADFERMIYENLAHGLSNEMYKKLNVVRREDFARHQTIFHTKIAVEFLGENDAFSKYQHHYSTPTPITGPKLPAYHKISAGREWI